MTLLRKIRTAGVQFSNGGFGAVWDTGRIRLADAAAHVRRWLGRDRAWVGRLLALTGHAVWIEGRRFSLAHPLVTNELRCRAMLGRYERSERQLLRDHLDPTLPVIELGGGLGIVACLTNTRLLDPAARIVVEANPGLVPVIEWHRALHGCGFHVVNAAIDYTGASDATLRVGTDFLSARVTAGSGTGSRVPVVTLADLLHRYRFPVCTVVCDIEGMEAALVANEGEILRRHVAFLFVEMHPEFRSEPERAAMVRGLEEQGFQKRAAARKVRLYVNQTFR